jgi:hypothetical protein
MTVTVTMVLLPASFIVVGITIPKTPAIHKFPRHGYATVVWVGHRTVELLSNVDSVLTMLITSSTPVHNK